MKETVGRLMALPAYRKAPDGDEKAAKGTKTGMMAGTVYKYREMAFRLLKADPNVRAALYQQAMASRAAQVTKDAPKTNRQEGAAAIKNLGKEFGVDLSGMVLAR